MVRDFEKKTLNEWFALVGAGQNKPTVNSVDIDLIDDDFENMDRFDLNKARFLNDLASLL